MIRAILFDLFDTLVWLDGERLLAGRDALAARAGVDAALLGEQWRRTSDARNRGLLGGLEAEIAQLLAAVGCTHSVECVHELAELERLAWRSATHLYEDTVDALRALRGAGRRLGIVSNCSCQGDTVVRELGLELAVDAVVLSWEVGVLKPDPAIYQVALERLEVAAEQTLLVDDLEDNLDTACHLGLRTVQMVRPGSRSEAGRRHPRVRSLAELWPHVWRTAEHGPA